MKKIKCRYIPGAMTTEICPYMIYSIGLSDLESIAPMKKKVKRLHSL